MSNFAIIGSVAAKYHYGDFPRQATDLDMVTETPWPADSKLHYTDYHFHPAFRAVIDGVDRTHMADPQTLYTIKVSHSFWDVAWSKTMHDILFFQGKGLTINEPLFKQLYAAWEDIHGKKKAKLNVMAEDFFKETVKRVYEHDSIHASVAYYDEPLFKMILKDGADVMVDRSKFEAMEYEDKLWLVREEVYATALERLIIPSGYRYSPAGAYAWALKQTITSFSKGWFPYFIVDNFFALRKPDVDYVHVHKVNQHKLIPLEG